MHVYVDGKQLEVPLGSKAQAVVDLLRLYNPDQALAVRINGELRDIDTVIHEGDHVHCVNFEDPEGKQIFWHTSAHVLAQAVLRKFPDALPTIGPAIDQGFYYDFANLTLSDADFAELEKEVQAILSANYPTERYLFQDRNEALEKFRNNPFKVALIEEFAEGPITGYRQGEFFDLCRGPHLPKLGKIKAFSILKTSGAYWKGDARNPMLTRIYGISFPERKQLKEYLHMLEEAQKRDHKILGPQLDLFSFKEEAPGIPLIHPRGMIVWNQLIGFLRELLLQFGYVEIQTPQLAGQELWERSGHWAYYRDNMYTLEVEHRHFALKPMNCPWCMRFYQGKSHSYRDLPLRVAEFGHVHRQEFSGALSGLFRVRSFHQDDAHLFMAPADIEKEILDILNFVREVYGTFGLTYRFELSTRPKDSIGSDEDWDLATESLRRALTAQGAPFRINEGDGAFYGPKIDIHIQDALGRSWQCGTVQLDMALPEKFDLGYMDKDGQLKRPVMVHRAILGSIERFLGILIEHFAGRLPLWISPSQVTVVTVADRHRDYALEVARAVRKAQLRCDVDDSSESMNKKIRKAQLMQVNYIVVVGDQEAEHRTISVRSREGAMQSQISLATFIDACRQERDSRAFRSHSGVP